MSLGDLKLFKTYPELKISEKKPEKLPGNLFSNILKPGA